MHQSHLDTCMNGLFCIYTLIPVCIICDVLVSSKLYEWFVLYWFLHNCMKDFLPMYTLKIEGVHAIPGLVKYCWCNLESCVALSTHTIELPSLILPKYFGLAKWKVNWAVKLSFHNIIAQNDNHALFLLVQLLDLIDVFFPCSCPPLGQYTPNESPLPVGDSTTSRRYLYFKVCVLCWLVD